MIKKRRFKVTSIIMALALIINSIIPIELSLSAEAKIRDTKTVIETDENNKEELALLDSDNSIDERTEKIFNLLNNENTNSSNVLNEYLALNTDVSYTIIGNTEVNNIFDIAVNISGVNDLYGGSIDFKYDPNLIEVQSITKGDIFGSQSILTPLGSNGKINQDSGQASFAITLQGNKVGTSNNGTLAIIRIKALKEGVVNFNTTTSNSTLSLDGATTRVKLSNSFANSITYTSRNTSISIVSNERYDLNLNSITLSYGSLQPEFSQDITSYNVTVPYEINNIGIYANALDSNATVTGTGNKKLVVGNNTVILKVSAPNGQSKNYIVNIIREAKIIDEAHISYSFSGDNHEGKEFTININGSNVQDLFAASFEFAYDNELIEVISANLGEAFKDREVFENYKDENSLVSLDATILGNVNGITADEVNIFEIKVRALKEGVLDLNTAIAGVQLTPNSNSIRTKLVGADIYSNNVYFIPTTSDLGYNIDILSVNNNLSSISLSNGNLEPEFSSDITEYIVNVDNDVTSIDINVETEHINANVYGTGTKELVVGVNEVSLQVIAESGDSKIYNITVNRAPSNNTNIEGVFGSGDVTFNEEEKLILMNVDSNSDYVNIELNLSEGSTWKLYSDEEYTNEVDKENIFVQEGNNIFYIRVIAQDGISTDEYRLEVYREIPDRIAPEVLSVNTYSENYIPGDNIRIVVEFNEVVKSGVKIKINTILGEKELEMNLVDGSNGTLYEANYLVENGEYGDVTAIIDNVSDELGNSNVEPINLGKVFVINFRDTDLTKDGLVDLRDLGYIGKLYNSVIGDELYDESADFNNDGIIDLYDIIIVSREF